MRTQYDKTLAITKRTEDKAKASQQRLADKSFTRFMVEHNKKVAE